MLRLHSEREEGFIAPVTALPFVPCPELPATLRAIATAQRQHFHGNLGLKGCPLFAGWRFQIGRYTTPDERKALRNLGWNFSGGWWYQRDEKPYGYGQ